VLRGNPELAPLARALEALAGGDSDGARELLAEADPAWTSALAPWLAPQ